MKTRIVRFGIGLAFLVGTGGQVLALCASPSVQLTTTAVSGTTQTVTLNFSSFSMTAGQMITIAGLTFTASASLSGAAAFTIFENLANGATSGGATANGTYSGILTGWSSAPRSGNTITFTSTSAPFAVLPISTGFVSPATTPPTPPTQTGSTSGSSRPSLSGLLTGNTACVGTPPTGVPGSPWTNQEFHQGGGALIDWKLGATNPDQTKNIGTWTLGGTAGSPTVAYLYGGSPGGTYTVWQNTDGTYSFCNGTTVIANATMKTGQGPCP